MKCVLKTHMPLKMSILMKDIPILLNTSVYKTALGTPHSPAGN
jgi:hypothetical protein